jgi:hypothetical protein
MLGHEGIEPGYIFASPGRVGKIHGVPRLFISLRSVPQGL